MSDFSAGYFISLFLALVIYLIGASVSWSKANSHYAQRCAKACDEKVASRDDGICSCLDGRVFAWQQGYTLHLGKP